MTFNMDQKESKYQGISRFQIKSRRWRRRHKKTLQSERAELWQRRAALPCLFSFFPEKVRNEGQNETSQFVTQWNCAMKHFTTWTLIQVHSFRPKFLSCCCIRQGRLLLRVRSLCFFSCFLCIFAMFCSLAMRNVEETKCAKFGLTPRVKTMAGGWMRFSW